MHFIDKSCHIHAFGLIAAAGVLLTSAVGASAQTGQIRPGLTRVVDADPTSPGRKIVFGRGDDARIAGPKHPPIDQIPFMPMPEFRQPGPEADPGVTTYDAETRTATPLPVRPASGLDSAQGGGSFVGALANVSTGFEMQRSFGTMTEATSLDTWPRSGNVKLVMHFVDTNGVDRWFVASGSMQDSGVVLTAAHCVYARSPNGITINDWATEVFVYPAWDGVGDQNSPGPLSDDVIQNFGWCRSTSFLAGSAYIDSGDSDRDCGLIRLSHTGSRSIGMLTGWFGWAWGGCETGRTFNNFSYPAEDCSATLHTGRTMYYWSGQFDNCPLFTNQLHLNTGGNCLDTVWGGMSGSGAYYTDGGDRFVNAVASTSDRDDDGYYCKLWEQFVNDMQDFEDTTRGNTLDLEALRFRVNGSTSVHAGEDLPASSVIIANATDANPASDTYTLRVYLSSNNNISSTDTLLATYNYNGVNFAAMDNIAFNIPAVEIPVGTNPGTYWVGVILDDGTDGNTNNNDTDTWDAQQITVTSCLLPGAPNSVVASDGTSCANVVLTWNAVSGATNYLIYRNTVNNSATATYIGSDTASPHNDPAPTTDPYYYWIRAVDACGTSGFSAPGLGYRDEPPSAPTGVTASDGTSCGVISIGWNTVADATSYDVYRNTVNNSATATLLSNNTVVNPIFDGTALPGVTYYYWVRAVNACGNSGLSTSNSGFRDTVLAAPTNLSASDNTLCNGVTVQYSAVSGATSYDIYRNTVNNSATSSLLGSAAPGILYLDATAVAGTTYYYWARAHNPCGDSAYSGSDQGTRAAALAAAPGNVLATDATVCNAVQVSWNAVAGASGYEIWRNTVNNSGTAAMIASDSASPYLDATVVGSNLYYYWVKATNGCGAGPFSATNRGNAGTSLSITTQPVDRIAPVGASISFNVVAPGNNTYQWHKGNVTLVNGGNISGATSSTLTINPIAQGDAGSYYCGIFSACGGITSDVVTLTVRCPADFDDGSGTGTPDGGIGIEDLLYYLGIYGDGNAAADVDDGSNTGTLDGGVGIEDLLFFLSHYDTGC